MREDILNNAALSALLDKMLECNAACAGNFTRPVFVYKEDLIEWLCQNLPVVPYVVDQITNFVFSNDLTTGDDDADVKLKEFLFAKNIKGETNYSVLQQAFKEMLIFGKGGIRKLSLEDGIISVKSKNYASLVDENEEYYGFNDTIGYIVAMKDQKIWETDLDEIDIDRELFEQRGVVIDKERKIIILSKEEMLNARLDTSNEDGASPLTADLQRIELLITGYERLNYDLKYDGPGRIVLSVNDDYLKGDAGETSTSEIINQTMGAKDQRVEKVKKEVEGIARGIKESGSDQVIALSNVFNKDVTHLPRVTKATEFLDYVENAGQIICEIFGIHPSLLEFGDISGNVSMEKILDNAMLNCIVPYREKYATQVSGLLAEWLGFEKIYFDKYEMQQAVDENDKRVKVVNMIQKLQLSGYGWLADKFAQMLSNDIDAGGGMLKNLKTFMEERMKKLGAVFKRE